MKQPVALLILAAGAGFACSEQAAAPSAEAQDAADAVADAVPTQEEAAAAAASEINDDNAAKILAEIEKELGGK